MCDILSLLQIGSAFDKIKGDCFYGHHTDKPLQENVLKYYKQTISFLLTGKKTA